MWGFSPTGYKPMAPGQSYEDYTQQQKSASKKRFLTTAAIAGSTFAAAPALAGLFAAAPAAGAAGVPASFGAAADPFTAAAIAKNAAPSLLSKLGGLTDLFSLGTNAALSIYGNKQAKKGADQARMDTLEANRQALALQRQELEQRQKNADLDREDQRKLNDAVNALKKQELDIMQEQNAYTRSQQDYERQLVEQREARLAPARELSAKAQQRLAALWGL